MNDNAIDKIVISLICGGEDVYFFTKEGFLSKLRDSNTFDTDQYNKIIENLIIYYGLYKEKTFLNRELTYILYKMSHTMTIVLYNIQYEGGELDNVTYADYFDYREKFDVFLGSFLLGKTSIDKLINIFQE